MVNGMQGAGPVQPVQGLTLPATPGQPANAELAIATEAPAQPEARMNADSDASRKKASGSSNLQLPVHAGVDGNTFPQAGNLPTGGSAPQAPAGLSLPPSSKSSLELEEHVALDGMLQSFLQDGQLSQKEIGLYQQVRGLFTSSPAAAPGQPPVAAPAEPVPAPAPAPVDTAPVEPAPQPEPAPAPAPVNTAPVQPAPTPVPAPAPAPVDQDAPAEAPGEAPGEVDAPAPAPAPTAPSLAPQAPGRAFPAGTRFYGDPASPSAKTYGAPSATWLTGSKWDTTTIQRMVQNARNEGSVPVFVQYGIPGRDGGGPSSGGAANVEAYLRQVEANARAIGDSPAVVVVEPDALGLGLNPDTVRAAVERYRELCPNAKIYIDAGHSSWKSAEETTSLLVRAGISSADGFSLNVSAFEWTKDNLAFGDRIVSALQARDPALAGKQYVVDTSRNGNGPGVDENGKRTWGDPVRAVNGGPISNGPMPTSETNHPNAAAFMWIKPPGTGDNRTRSAMDFGGESWVKRNANAPLGPQ